LLSEYTNSTLVKNDVSTYHVQNALTLLR